MTELHGWVKSRIWFPAGGLATPSMIYHGLLQSFQKNYVVIELR
jgi:hypothetical protein